MSRKVRPIHTEMSQTLLAFSSAIDILESDCEVLWILVIILVTILFTASWETCMQVRKQHLELDMEQQTGSK